MCDRVISKIPFTSLHAHTTYSMFDGYGEPHEHVDFAFQNGCEAYCVTEHGNMNSVPHILQHTEQLRKDGKNIKPIFGIEAYFIPSIQNWKQWHEDAKKTTKNFKKEAEQSAVVIADEGDLRKEIKNKLKRRAHLILLATSQVGLNNLFKIVSDSYVGDNFYKYPRVDYAQLKKYNEGIVASSACLGGHLAQSYWDNKDKGRDAVIESMMVASQKMKDIFGDRWFHEIQWNLIPEQHELNRYVIDVAEILGVDLISAADSHYPSPERWKDRELYKRLGWMGKKKPEWLDDNLPQSVDDLEYQLFPKNGDQMWDSYKEYSAKLNRSYNDDIIRKSIENTQHIVDNMVQDFAPDTSIKLPSFVVPAGQTADYALEKMAFDGLSMRGHSKNEEYAKRLKYELSVISQRDFSKYFLTMKAVTNRAKRVQLAGAGRGSAAGSLLSYVLDITEVDPIKYDLQFERFLLKDSIDLPDIDVDLESPMEFKETLIEEWGDNTVVPISNFNTLKVKSLVKDISKFYDIPFEEVNAITRIMDKEAKPAAKAKHKIGAGMYEPTYEDLKEFSASFQGFLRKYPLVGKHVDGLLGNLKAVSAHAGGMIISENLDRHMPLIASKRIRQSPWTEGQARRHLEPMGFVKFDVLGLDALKAFSVCIRHILKRHCGVSKPTFDQVKEWYNNNIHPDTINLNDQNVYKNVFHKSNYVGIFQFTNKGVQDFATRVKPSSLEELSDVTSIWRPGPLSSSVDDQYLTAKRGERHVEYIHPLEKEVTEKTYGLIIYQEQISELIHKLGKDLSLDDGNKFRKFLIKKGIKSIEKKKQVIIERFIEGCREKGISRQYAEQLLVKMEAFASYGFCLAHSCAYSIITYQCAWLYTHYPSEWLAAFLSKEPEKRKEKAITLAKGAGFEIKDVDINLSSDVWELSKDGKALIAPLNSVKGLGSAAIEQIINNRPYRTIEHLIFNDNIVYSKLNKKALDVLCRSGALNSLIDHRFNGTKHFWSCVAVDRVRKLNKFFDNIMKYQDEGDFSKEEAIENKVSLTGNFPIDLIMSKEVEDKINEYCISPIGDYDSSLGIAWFIPRELVLRKTKNGKDYAIISVLDDTGSMTSIKCWGWRNGKDKINLNKVYIGKVDFSEQWGFSVRNVYKNLKLIKEN